MSTSTVSDAEIGRMESVANGKAQWDEATLGKIVDANEQAVEMMVRGASMPYCEWGVDRENGWTGNASMIMPARSLARLNALTAHRLAARGDSKGATRHLLAGIRFTRDLAQNTPLINALVARAILPYDLNSAVVLFQSGRITAADKASLVKVVRALPPDVFDWSRTVYVEMDGIRNGQALLKKSSDPKKLIADLGKDPNLYGSDPRPTEKDLLEFDSTMREAVRVFAMPSAQAEDGIRLLNARVQKLSPITRDALRWFDTAHKARKEVEELRSAFLKKASS